MHISGDTFLAIYISFALILTTVYMAFGVNRREVTDFIFTFERFAWSALWVMISILGLMEAELTSGLRWFERSIMALASTLVLVWTAYLYERNSNHVDILRQRINRARSPLRYLRARDFNAAYKGFRTRGFRDRKSKGTGPTLRDRTGNTRNRLVHLSTLARRKLGRDRDLGK